MNSSVILRVVAGLGLFQAVVGAMILTTCRCTGGSRLGPRLLKNGVFRKLYKYHCYLWWPFWASVGVHAILAVYLTGFPF